MKPGLALFGILSGVLIAGGALAADGGPDAAADAAADSAAGTAGSDAGVAGGGGAAGSEAGAGGFAGEITCGPHTCKGWTVAGFTVPPCCAGPQDQKCGAMITDQLAGFGLPAGCQETEQVGIVGCGCPDLPLSVITLPGCCREASSTCGAVADLTQLGGPNMGCMDPSIMDGGAAPQTCDYAACQAAAGAAGSAGAAGAGGAATGGTAGKPSTGGSAGTATAGAAGASSGKDEEDEGGCGCRMPGSNEPTAAWLAALALVAATGLRRRRERSE